MSCSKNNLEKLFVKHKIRKFTIKLKRLSEEGLQIMNTLISLNDNLLNFPYLEYRIARENTLLKRYGIRRCYVKVTQLSAQGMDIKSKCTK